MPEPKYKTAVFDDQGNDIAGAEAEDDSAAPPVLEADAAAEETTDDAAPPPVVATKGKYRIGDKEFATAEDAHAYATSTISALETERQVADAYRLGIQDATVPGNPPPGVTPPAAAAPPAFDEALYYENPGKFLESYANKIKNETLNAVNQNMTEKQIADRLWSEFSARHPDLADFRNEAENFAAQNLSTLRVVNQTKGISAGYDYIALKLRAEFSRYAQAVKPRKQLANSGGGATPPGSNGVTPPPPKKKVLSFNEQIRSIKPRR